MAEAAAAKEGARIIRDRLDDVAGYRVETAEGTLGNVAAVLPSVGDVPGVLLVHTDPRACTLTAVRFDDVDAVDADSQCVVLRGRGRDRPKGPEWGCG